MRKDRPANSLNVYRVRKKFWSLFKSKVSATTTSARGAKLFNETLFRMMY